MKFWASYMHQPNRLIVNNHSYLSSFSNAFLNATPWNISFEDLANEIDCVWNWIDTKGSSNPLREQKDNEDEHSLLNLYIIRWLKYTLCCTWITRKSANRKYIGISLYLFIQNIPANTQMSQYSNILNIWARSYCPMI